MTIKRGERGAHASAREKLRSDNDGWAKESAR